MELLVLKLFNFKFEASIEVRELFSAAILISLFEFELYFSSTISLL